MFRELAVQTRPLAAQVQGVALRKTERLKYEQCLAFGDMHQVLFPGQLICC